MLPINSAMMSKLILFSIVSLLASIPPAIASPGDVLVVRYVWAPIFCFAGSFSGVPKEFCGLQSPALKRFIAHRMARILIADKNGNIKENCASPSSFDYSKLPAHLQQALHCVDNSYTIGNDAGLHQFVWGYQGACAAQGSDLRGNATAYFQLEADLFAKYNPDRTLKAAGYDLTKLSTIDAKAYLTTVLKGWGGGATSGFYTCDKATGTRLSALNVCFTTTAPYTIAKCPSGLLGKNGDCSSKLVVYKKNSIPVPPECKAYYP